MQLYFQVPEGSMQGQRHPARSIPARPHDNDAAGRAQQGWEAAVNAHVPNSHMLVMMNVMWCGGVVLFCVF